MLPTLPNLDGLIGLARQDGVDVRPTLVRVLTDLYVQKPTHTREEEHRFTELSLSLLTGVDVPTRAAVAKKLAAYAGAPHAVVRRLAGDVLEVAESILKGSACLTGDDLLAIIRDFGPSYAAAIGARDSVEAAADHAAEAETPITSPEPSHRTAADAPLAELKPARAEPVAIGDYFLSAGSSERRLLLANLEDQSAGDQSPPLTADGFTAELETAALARRPDDFASGLERILNIPGERARRIVDDMTGEPIVVVARALAMPQDAVLRILLFLNPSIGESVERVFDLVRLFEQVSAPAALHLVASWQNRHSAEHRHQSLHFDDERRGARRTFAEHGRRPGIGQQKSAITNAWSADRA